MNRKCVKWTSCVLSGLFAIASSAVAQHTPSGETAHPVTIKVDLDQRIGAYKPIYAWFGYDEANFTTMRDGRTLMKELHDLSPVPITIRAHHMLTSGNGVPELKWSSTGVYSEDEHGKPMYNFTLLDGIFDAYRDAGVRPMVELGFMPKDLAADVPGRPEPYQVHYPASTVSGRSNNPPKDYAKWGELCRMVTQHLVQRYGHDAVRRWYFEVWNEPDIDYWHGSPQDYFKLYDYAVAGVRAALPNAIVGGPATTSPRSDKAYAFLKAFLDHVRDDRSAADGNAIPLNFISFHAKGQPIIQNGEVAMGIRSELRDVDRGFSLIASYPQFKPLPIILSEADPEGCAACSSKVNPANNYRNGTLYPAYTAAAYKRLFELADKHGVNLISMLSWSFEFEDRDSFEGFRDLSTNGVDKPILNFFRMAAKMSGTRVSVTSSAEVPLDKALAEGIRGEPDVAGMATRDSHSVASMLWNYNDAAASTTAASVQLTMTQLPNTVHTVRVTEYRIDSTHSNAYTVWQQLGSPAHPTPDQLRRLKSVDGLQSTGPAHRVAVKNANVTISVALPAQSVALFLFDW
ncbi:beta-xylosidase [Terriglobus sp. RCC_193]|uniref:GH39 family glycosyl hydrolase n=1 Tax=Terriglobus sp. RCC_193 TaxID=3239218 RepID=UPI003525CC85